MTAIEHFEFGLAKIPTKKGRIKAIQKDIKELKPQIKMLKQRLKDNERKGNIDTTEHNLELTLRELNGLENRLDIEKGGQ